MGKDSAPAPKPDPLIGQAAQGNVELGREALEFARQQYADGKIRQEDLDQITKQVAQSALDSQDKSNQWAQEDRDKSDAAFDKYTQQGDEDRQLGRDTMKDLDKIGDLAESSAKQYEQIYGAEAQYQSKLGKGQVDRYGKTFVPVEDQVASDAMNWDSAGRQELMASEAKADALDAGQRAKDASMRSMSSMGVNPNSGRFAATDSANATAVALAGAGAQNTARNAARMQGVQLRQQAAQLGQQVLGSGQQANSLSMQAAQAAQQSRLNGFNTLMATKNQGLAAAGIGNTTASLGLSNQGAGYTGLGSGLQAGNAAIGANAAGTAGFNANGAVMQGGFGAGMQGNTTGAGIANNLYGNQLNAWGQQNSSNTASANGTMGAIGTVAGAAIMAF